MIRQAEFVKSVLSNCENHSMVGRFTKLEQVLSVSTMMNEFKATIVQDTARTERGEKLHRMKQTHVGRVKDLADY
jgi:hypothetical protein